MWLPSYLADCDVRLPTSYAVHAALNDPASGYPAAEAAEAVRHTPAQVRTLLGVM